MSFKRCLFFIWLRKMVMATAIIILVLLPKEIYRNPISTKSESFQMTFCHINFQPRHLFCSSYEMNGVVSGEKNSAKDEDVLQALNLPNRTWITDEIREYGQCLAKSKGSGKSSDMCLCQQRPAYLLLLAGCIVSIIVDHFRFCILPVVSQCSLAVDPTDTYREDCFMMFDAIGWLMVACVALIFHLIWFDEILLPDAVYKQSYFARPTHWTVAVSLAFVLWLCCSVEFLYVKLRRRRQLGTSEITSVEPVKKAVEEQELKEVAVVEEQGETWSVESYPEDVKERLTWRIISRHTGSKTWP